MRIAILNDPNNFHTEKWAQALAAAGAEVVVMSYDRYRGAALEAITLQPPWGRGGRYSYLDYLHGGEVLRKALLEHRIDLLNPLNITPFGLWAARAGHHPTLACAFGADILEYAPPGTPGVTAGRTWESTEAAPGPLSVLGAALKRKFYRRRVAEALAHADHITGDNQVLVDAMADWFGVAHDRLTVLPWGVEPALFAPDAAALDRWRARLGLREGQRLVLSPRGAKPIYQADIILEAFAQVLAGGRDDVVLVQLGAGYAVAPAVAARAQALAQAHPNFHFIAEAVPRAELHQLWLLADAFVSAPVYDGYSAALAEGRYAGAVPIVNDIPAHRELVRHEENGWVCVPFTVAHLAQCIETVLERLPELKPQYAAVNRAWIEAHSLLPENARRFLALAEGLLQR